MSNPNLSVWDQVCVTDPAYAKDFSRAGGFAGTAINPTYLAKRATEVFGPAGLGWGINIIDEVYKEGAPIIVNNAVVGRECVHIIRAGLWYLLDGKKGEVIQFGQTTFVGKNKYGPFTDEEAPKKSLTDAMSKCLSILGFSADIHSGQWDANKFVNQATGADEFLPTNDLGQQAPKMGGVPASVKSTEIAKPTPTRQDLQVDVEKEKQNAIDWEKRISEVKEIGDLDRARNLADGTFKTPPINQRIKQLIDDRKKELLSQ